MGSIMQACLCAVVWARMLRPKRRGQEVVFSKYACIVLNEQGDLCFTFRISDIDGTFLVSEINLLEYLFTYPLLGIIFRPYSCYLMMIVF